MTSMGAESLEALVEGYARAAAAHGEATEVGDSRKANAAHLTIASTYRELRARGLDAQRALLPLLDDPRPGVRLWAGAHALEFAAAEGERALLALSARQGSLVAFGASMTLRVWREGKLSFP